MLKSLAYSLSIACLALAAGAFAIAQAPGELAISRVYQTADGIPVVQLDAPLLAVKPYHVTDAAAFRLLALPLPARAFVFRAGLYQTPGIDYDAMAGGTLRVRPGVLTDGDTVTIVSLLP